MELGVPLIALGVVAVARLRGENGQLRARPAARGERAT